MPDPDTVPPTVAVVRIPPFWPADPEMWFAQVENQFAIAGITADSTKFHYVAGNLDCRYSTEVRNILTQPPAMGKYEKLRTELVKRLSALQVRKTKQLLETEDMGDRRPSQFQTTSFAPYGWTNTSLDTLADAIADTNPQPQAAAVSSLEAMVDKMAVLMSAKIGEMARICGYRSRSRSKGPPGACWYHRRFGDAAHRCATPCTYQTENDKGTR
ncbi:uncharacterized protein LOC134532209 [Bacillus rossius redtenbacheri]|uniref:uncharacterized protein LOC134532209 n=1 Tax=Bacillus rossius redtenbacheri TaxID=93214 RepID=UPI002FDD01BF